MNATPLLKRRPNTTALIAMAIAFASVFAVAGVVALVAISGIGRAASPTQVVQAFVVAYDGGDVAEMRRLSCPASRADTPKQVADWKSQWTSSVRTRWLVRAETKTTTGYDVIADVTVWMTDRGTRYVATHRLTYHLRQSSFHWRVCGWDVKEGPQKPA